MSNSIEVVPPQPTPKKNFTIRDLKVGQIGKTGYQPSFLVIRTKEGATFLSDGSGSPSSLDYELAEILPPGTVVKLTVGE